MRAVLEWLGPSPCMRLCCAAQLPGGHTSSSIASAAQLSRPPFQHCTTRCTPRRQGKAYGPLVAPVLPLTAGEQQPPIQRVRQGKWATDVACFQARNEPATGAPTPPAQVVGGPPKREGLLVGLKSGAVLQVFLDNPFVLPMVQHGGAVRCLDLSADRRRLAVVDEASRLCVYDVLTKV
jgi:hypothetical protein